MNRSSGTIDEEVKSSHYKSYSELSFLVIDEIRTVLGSVEDDVFSEFIKVLRGMGKIVTCGAGRMGMMARAFAMRLMHLGFESYYIGDCNTPRIGENDALLVCSGSGETETILSLVKSAHKNGSKILLITTRDESSMATLADKKIVFKAPSKVSAENVVLTIQPMTTLTEQSTLLILDIMVLYLMQSMGIDEGSLKIKHSILE